MKTSLVLLSLVLLTLLTACSSLDDAVPAGCHFASGRPCPLGHVCLGSPGDDCNYYSCHDDGHLLGGGILCSGNTSAPQLPTGTFNCDPADLGRSSTPPLDPCPIGQLASIITADGQEFLSTCVRVEQCRPIGCDPQWSDGCPTGWSCGASSHKCEKSGDGHLDGGAPAVCHFESGRPCPAGTFCLGPPGGECNYFWCQDGQLASGAVACGPDGGVGGPFPPPQGTFDCDPALIHQPTFAPNTDCPIGQLASIKDNHLDVCVNVSQCRPIACDPQWSDGCPLGWSCSAASLTCQQQ